METIESRTGSSNKTNNLGRDQAMVAISEAQPHKGKDDDEDEGLIHRSRLIQQLEEADFTRSGKLAYEQL